MRREKWARGTRGEREVRGCGEGKTESGKGKEGEKGRLKEKDVKRKRGRWEEERAMGNRGEGDGKWRRGRWEEEEREMGKERGGEEKGTERDEVRDYEDT